MIKRELAKDPKLANENWERFLPKFRRRHEAKRKAVLTEAPAISGSNNIALDGSGEIYAAASGEGEKKDKKDKKDKKAYTPFPPAQLPSKVRPSSFPVPSPLLSATVVY